MRNKDCISRCLHILCRLKRDQKATFAQIQCYLSEMSILTGEDYNISIRTFQRDVETIRELFLIDVRYSRGEGPSELLGFSHVHKHIIRKNRN
jgi:predicted DNA-binding transcriptional regulator YafY